MAVALSLLTLKEDMALAVLALGLYALGRKQTRVGLTLVLLGAAWLPLVLLVVLPHFRPAGSTELISFHYQSLGANAREILTSLVFRPWLVVMQILGRCRTRWTLVMLAASMWPALFSRISLLALPLLLAHLASDYPHQMDLTWQYSAGILPFLLYAIIRGVPGLPRRWRWLWLIPTIPVIILRFPDPFPEGLDWGRTVKRHRLIDMVPAEASLSVSNSLAPYVINRPEVLLYPRIGDAQYVLVDLSANIYPAPWETRFQDLEDSTGHYRLLYEEDGMYLMKRR